MEKGRGRVKHNKNVIHDRFLICTPSYKQVIKNRNRIKMASTHDVKLRFYSQTIFRRFVYLIIRIYIIT